MEDVGSDEVMQDPEPGPSTGAAGPPEKPVAILVIGEDVSIAPVLEAAS